VGLDLFDLCGSWLVWLVWVLTCLDLCGSWLVWVLTCLDLCLTCVDLDLCGSWLVGLDLCLTSVGLGLWVLACVDIDLCGSWLVGLDLFDFCGSWLDLCGSWLLWIMPSIVSVAQSHFLKKRKFIYVMKLIGQHLLLYLWLGHLYHFYAPFPLLNTHFVLWPFFCLVYLHWWYCACLLFFAFI